MYKILKLLLPAILPSWRFFDFIAPSPRIQFALLNDQKVVLQDWQEFRPRPAHLPFSHMLRRMVWNPRWNESLFLVSCAERLMENPTQHSENEILKRISDELKENAQTHNLAATHLQFRLTYIHRHDSQLIKEITFLSRIHVLSEKGIA